nr:pertactin autotransporter [Pseudomonas sp. FFPRI_1]
MKAQATQLSAAMLTVLLSSMPSNALARVYPGIDLSSPGGEARVLDAGDEVINGQVGTAVQISGSQNALSADGVRIESGIAGTGVGSNGIRVSSGGSLELSNSTINMLGAASAVGVRVQNTDSTAVLTGNRITTEGYMSDAVLVEAGGHAEVEGGSITSSGAMSHGLSAAGEDATIIGKHLDIAVQGNNSAAVHARDGGSVVLDQATLRATGSDAQSSNNGIEITRGSVTATHSEITTLWGIGAKVAGGTLSLNQSSINAQDTGIHLSSASGPKLTPSTAVLTDVKVHSEQSYGLNIQGDGVQAELERVQISSNGSYASGISLTSKGVVTVKDSTIEMSNDSGLGIDNRAGSLTMDGGSITTRGSSGHGLYASQLYPGSGGSATIRASGVAIETFGRSAIGVVSRTAVSDIELTGGSVTTHGERSYALLANGGRLQVTGTKVRTLGDFATGLMFGNSGTRGALDWVDMRTSGAGADGIVAYSATAGVDHELTLSNSYIETEDGAGIAVKGSGLTANLVDTTLIGKSRSGNGTALRIGEWDNDSTPGAPAIAARAVQLNAQRSYLEGDVVVDSGSASLSLQDHSTLLGALQVGADGRTLDRLHIDDSSTWQVRGDSTLKDLQTTGTISFDTPGSGFKVLDVLGNLTGSGLFEMRTDLGRGQGDLLRVAGNIEGQHQILVANSGAEPTMADGAVQLVQSAGGAGHFSLANRDQVVDIGTYRYELKSDDALGGRASDWSLVNTGRNLADDPEAEISPAPEHLSTAASAAVNTSAASTAQAIWHAESGVLAKRMRELRQVAHAEGLWSRGFGERQHLNNAGARGFEQTVSGLQLGADKALAVQDGRLYIGALAGYSQADRSFHSEGKGNADSYFLGGYVTWLADNGWYLDSLLKANRIRQDFKVQATDGESVKGKTTQSAIGATLEIGRQLQLGEGWFIEPQAGLSVAHVSGDHYRTSNDLDVSAGAGNSRQLNAGLQLGRRFDLGKEDFIQPYVKLAQVHEFDGKSTVRSNNIPIRTDLSGGHTKLGLGISAALGEHHRLYADYEHAGGSQLDKPWSVSAGYSYTW